MAKRPARYERNRLTITVEEQEVLAASRVAVVGCGGLGGYLVEMLGRAGVGTIVAVDGDVFDETNLNRQLYSTVAGIGASKAQAAADRMAAINPLITVEPVEERVTSDNAERILRGCNAVVDGLDGRQARLLVERTSEQLGIPFIHGAIAGWYAQVTTVLPGSRTLERLYAGKAELGVESQMGNPSFTPALAASIEVSECIKALLGKGELLDGKLLVMDLLEQEFNVIELG